MRITGQKAHAINNLIKFEHIIMVMLCIEIFTNEVLG